jgi:two-component system phosphate regulon response regulator PhoB
VSKGTITVIEDDPDILEVIDYNLRREGYRVFGYRDGFHGLRRVREHIPDLVLVDLLLPGVDGMEICRRLKLDPQTSQIPVIIVTARGSETDMHSGMGAGATDYIVRPPDIARRSTATFGGIDHES